MAHSLSALKRMRQSEKRRGYNRAMKSTIRTAIKKFLSAIQSKNASGAKEELSKVYKLYDKAAIKGVLHKNNAARHKSRLALKVPRLIRKVKAISRKVS